MADSTGTDRVEGRTEDGEDVRRWRTGRKVGRTIYAVVGTEPSDDDILIGMMDTAGLAYLVAAEHNRCLALDEGDRDGR